MKGNDVVVRIADNGTGIPEAIRQKIFEPFFTTKPIGKGTGQGLAIAHSVIVDKHKGRITVESEPGKGTTFIITLPVEDQDLVAKRIPPVSGGAPLGNPGTLPAGPSSRTMMEPGSAGSRKGLR